MRDSSSGDMSAQGKHSGDPAAEKPDRRRGAAGRAAALRRAPSDSDCSGETASLSADSGERRPPPPPPRGKTRNRRRGSEWEVLEGLKDGQRFERRPEVFNGFLHKKRKWPLKGWHKRFFVVDGGILVYARSPTDVARGRLHGSLDVGLSVISAKPRRRRIDIDADEFIYHLRAKTPDVFRTWLNVLKAHRLYRQHLLTFGARESAPKIHAPHDDLPPTDTSSRTSQTSRESLSSPTKSQTYTKSSRLCVSELTSSVYLNKSYNALSLCKIDEKLTPLDSNEPGYDSPFSTHCIEKRQDNRLTPSEIIPSVDEQQMHSTDLDLNTLNSSNKASESTNEMKSNKSLALNTKSSRKKNNPKQTPEMRRQLNTLENMNTRLSIDNSKKSTVWLDNKDPTALYFFSRKRRRRNKNEEDWAMKRSRKSTNLVKYRNSREEPCLTRPQLRQMLLCKYKRNIIRTAADKHVNCDLYNYDKKTDKSTQDAITASEYDDICEKLVFNLFDNFDHDCNPNGEGIRNSSIYVNLVVKELYDLKLNASKNHPIKSLFKSLLQYFLKTTDGQFKGSIKQDVATDKPSNTHFSRDVAVSNIINNAFKLTPESENIEKLINSTIYGFSIGKRKSRDTDIAITKTLINNLDALSTTFSNMEMEDNNVNPTDSAEIPLLQKYFKHILSETSISKAVAKDFLNAYLDVLDQRSRSATSIVSSEISVESYINLEPICEIQTECIQKKISKSISACKTDTCVGDTIRNPTDRSKLNIKEILDKIMDLFTSNKVDEEANDNDGTDINKNDNTDTVTRVIKSEALNSMGTSGTVNDNKIVIDLSKYDIANISLSNSENGLGPKCMTINLKEKTPHSNETKLNNSRLHITAGTSDKMKSDSDNTNPDYQTYVESNNTKDEHTINPQVPNDEVDLKTLSSGATSKANLNVTNDNFLDMSSNNTRFSKEIPHPNCKENTQCFFVSSIQEDVPKIQEKLKKSHHFMSSSLPAQNSMSKTVVNEDLILRILEHLIAMSRDIPGLNRDIKKLYLKSKKAYEEADVTGLSLLGKIYKKDNNRKSSDINNINSSKSAEVRRNVQKKAFEMAVNTSLILPSLKILENRALSAIIFAEALANIAVQTLSIDDEVNDRQIENSQDEWFKKLTQEYIKNNALKCMLKKYHHLPQSIRIAHPIRAKVPERFSVSKNTSMTTTEFTNLSPPLISNRSQKNIIDQLHNRKSKLVKAESMTDSSVHIVNNDNSDDLKTLYKCSSEPSFCSGLISPNGAPIRGPQAGFVSGTPGGRLAGWIVESGGPLESASRELGQAQLSVQQLQRLLDAMMELQNIHHHDTDVSLEGASPNVKKDRRKFGLRKKKSNSKCASVELAPLHIDASTSHMALSALTAPPSPGGGASSMPNSAASLPIACAAARPQSLPGAEALSVGTGGGPASLTSLTPDHHLREDFTILAKDLVANLKTVVSTLVVERGRLRAAMETAEPPAAGGVEAALRTNLSSALQQNSELRSRLSRIHDASDLAEISSVGNNSDQAPRPFPQSLSYSSSCVSASEFFDAEEHEDELKPAEIITTDEAGVIELDGDSSSEAGSLSSEEGSASSDNSDGATSAVIPTERTSLQNGSEPLPTICTRRSRLPCPRPTPASPSLWNLLYKNIGKDLSQISMPVTINEPLNMLQRLCEELEYSELLDSASSCNNALERMSLIAAFAVSAYAASAHRAASKPFNPLLAETYEYVRGDRDFRFIAEQVSHHPPISACHAESPRWKFWQEARIKTKFWGKSMEFQPTGRVHVRLTPSGDHYSWNKVTTCVHNLFGGQRWVDQYGDMHIVCHGTDITCKLQFIKASSWSSSRHEVRGVVSVGGSPRMRLQGRWSEGLQGGERTLWRPGAMPPDYELYYGFTRFAMELNELEPGMRDVLPSTDTRLRPDQRALEEGDVDAAEQFKHELEQAQRERRRDGVEHSPLWFRKTIEDGEETWVFTGEYWKAREAGFTDTPRLW